MLKGISPLISPDLLAALSRMGHGDELILADAHFPAETFGTRLVLRADGIDAASLLDAILPLFELDAYVEAPVLTMEAVAGDTLDPAVEASYRAALDRHACGWAKMARLERFAFYERAKSAFLIVVTGETRKYGNVLLKKGVTPLP
ncbi:MAG: L-fucose mutarotase [Kiritimatiellae bacterium]|nr:L-fucose mutarotase [Kiritimatiellia bacterium]